MCSILLDIVCDERDVKNKSEPVAVNEEQEGQETVDGCFGDDVGVQTVAEIDGVNVITREQSVIGRWRGCLP